MTDKDGKIVDLAVERRRRGPRFNGGLMGILEASRDLVCLCRSGTITAINGAGLRLLGAKSSDAVLGRLLGDFLVPEYGEVLRLFLSGRTSEDQPVATRILTLDQTTKDVEIQVFRAREIAPDATVVIGRELANLTRPEGAGNMITDGDPRLAALANNAFNMIAHAVDGVIRYINPAGLALLRTDEPLSAWIGRPLATLFQPLQTSADWDLAALVEGNCPALLRLQRADGSRVEAQAMIARVPSHEGVELMIEVRVTGAD